MDLMDLMKGQLNDQLLGQLAGQLGGADKGQTAAAANSILSTLIGAMAKNVSKPQGAESLAGALERDHDGSLLNDLSGYIQSNKSNPTYTEDRATNGSGILGHILGERQSGAIDMISKMSGLGSDKTGNLMAMLAPIVMQVLGQQKRQQGLNPSDLAGILTGAVKSAGSKHQEMSIIGKFLDQDGDGSIMDDLAGMGMKIFGNFLRRK